MREAPLISDSRAEVETIVLDQSSVRCWGHEAVVAERDRAAIEARASRVWVGCLANGDRALRASIKLSLAPLISGKKQGLGLSQALSCNHAPGSSGVPKLV